MTDLEKKIINYLASSGAGHTIEEITKAIFPGKFLKKNLKAVDDAVTQITKRGENILSISADGMIKAMATPNTEPTTRMEGPIAVSWSQWNKKFHYEPLSNYVRRNYEQFKNGAQWKDDYKTIGIFESTTVALRFIDLCRQAITPVTATEG